MEPFEFLRDQSLKAGDPVDFRCADARNLSGHLSRGDFGAVQLTSLTTCGPATLEVHRTAKMHSSGVRRFCLVLNVSGCMGLSQDGRSVTLRSGDMSLHDPVRPYFAWRRADRDRGRVILVGIPTELMTLRPARVDELIASRLPADPPLGALVSAMVRQLADDSHRLTRPDALRLAPTIADLVALMLSSALEARPDRSQAVLLSQVQDFIEARLNDPTLAPSLVAAAHHIAPRTLNRVFARHGLTVAGWIRHRRLERCRRELADPQATQPIYALALRYGFSDAAHFTRAFKGAYGLPPDAYRRLCRDADHGDALEPSPLPGGRIDPPVV